MALGNPFPAAQERAASDSSSLVPATSVNRRRHAKSRGGCITCKIRRIKCDEGKPSCKRCLSTGRKCDGYTPLGVVTIVVDVSDDDQERRGYHYFRMKTVGEILGQQDATFWRSLLLQTSHAEPAIKHALIAVASLHESLELSGYNAAILPGIKATDKLRVLSLHHYNKAIQLIRSDYQDESKSGNLSPAIILLLCILFLCYEEFRSGYVACFLHLDAAMKLFQQWTSISNGRGGANKFSASDRDLVEKHIGPMLRRLQVQACMFMDCRHTQYAVKSRWIVTVPVIPAKYDSLSDAREALDHYMSYMFSVLELYPTTKDQVLLSIVQQMLADWLEAFNHYLGNSVGNRDPSAPRAIANLMLYYNICLMAQVSFTSPYETVFDAHMSTWRQIVDLAREIFNIDSATTSSSSPNQEATLDLIFSFDLGITPALFFVATRCRDPTIRREALSLMTPTSRKRGAWNSAHSALAARRIMELEEQGATTYPPTSHKDVPEAARVRKVFAHINPENGYLMMQYVRPPFLEDSPLEVTYVSLRRLVGQDEDAATGLEERLTRMSMVGGFEEMNYHKGLMGS